MIHANKQCIKANEQVGREMLAIRDVVRQRAERRMREGINQYSPVKTLPGGSQEKGKSHQ
jgi:hypothetical protein